MPSPFPCSPVIREWSWKKTQIEKKKKKNWKNIRPRSCQWPNDRERTEIWYFSSTDQTNEVSKGFWMALPITWEWHLSCSLQFFELFYSLIEGCKGSFPLIRRTQSQRAASACISLNRTYEVRTSAVSSF